MELGGFQVAEQMLPKDLLRQEQDNAKNKLALMSPSKGYSEWSITQARSIMLDQKVYFMPSQLIQTKSPKIFKINSPFKVNITRQNKQKQYAKNGENKVYSFGRITQSKVGKYIHFQCQSKHFIMIIEIKQILHNFPINKYQTYQLDKVIQMQCVNGNKGHFLCINRDCEHKNNFICSDPTDQCKDNHQSCSLINLSYLLKKSKADSSIRAKSNRYDKLIPIYEKCKAIATTISNALASFTISKQINNLLEEGTPLLPQDKDKIAKFMNDRKIEQAQDNIYQKVQTELEQLQILINQFQFNMRDYRNKEIQQLKRKLSNDDKMKISKIPFETNTQILQGAKTAKKKQSSQIFKSDQQIISPQKNMKVSQISNFPSAFKSKVSQKSDGVSKLQKLNSAERGKSNSMRPRPNDFEQKISKIVKNHIPKGPLFSKITNDIETLYAFFQQKFQSAKLLYRASENDYLVSRFHEKCDGHKNTLTLVLTEFDKVIGGFTTLPWKSGGGQWYPDHKKQSFIFNLTSGEKYPLINQQRAIWCTKTYGPSFGQPDLQIADKAFYNSNSCTNFPNCYNNGNYKVSPASSQLFCGTKNGHFRIKQWEVYELEFQ